MQTLIDLDNSDAVEGARGSLLMDPQVAKKLFTLLAQPDDKRASLAKKRTENKLTSEKLLKTFIARGFHAMSWTLG